MRFGPAIAIIRLPQIPAEIIRAAEHRNARPATPLRTAGALDQIREVRDIMSVFGALKVSGIAAAFGVDALKSAAAMVATNAAYYDPVSGTVSLA